MIVKQRDAFARILCALILLMSLAFALVPGFAEDIKNPAFQAKSGDQEVQLEVRYEVGRLSVTAQKVDGVRLLKEIASKTGIAIYIYADDLKKDVSLNLDSNDLKPGLEKTLSAVGAKNHAIEFIAEGEEGNKVNYRIESIYIVKKSSPKRVVAKGEPVPAPMPAKELLGHVIGLSSSSSSQHEKQLLEMGAAAVPGLMVLFEQGREQGYPNWELIRILGKIGDPAALSFLQDEKRRLEGMTAVETRDAYVTVVSAINAIEARQIYTSMPFSTMTRQDRQDVLVNLLRSENPALADLAGQEILTEGETAAKTLMEAMRQRESVKLRQRGLGVVRELGRREGFDSYYPIIEEMLFAKEEGTVMGAVEVLTDVGDEPSRNMLLRKLETDNKSVRIVGKSLARLEEERALPSLVSYLAAPKYEVYGAAMQAIVNYGSRAAPHLRERLKEAGTDEKGRILVLLGRVGDSSDVAAVSAYRDDPDLGKAAEVALRSLTGK